MCHRYVTFDTSVKFRAELSVILTDVSRVARFDTTVKFRAELSVIFDRCVTGTVLRLLKMRFPPTIAVQNQEKQSLEFVLDTPNTIPEEGGGHIMVHTSLCVCMVGRR